MKKVLISMAALAAMSSAAMAQSASQDINLSANVGKFCTIGGSATPTAIAKTISTTSTGGVVTTPIPVSIGAVVCNTASNVQLKSTNGALIGGPSASGFVNYINYSATATIGSVAASVNANSTTGTSVPIAPTASPTGGATSDASVTVTITPVTNPLPLTAHNLYADILTVVVSPL